MRVIENLKEAKKDIKKFIKESYDNRIIIMIYDNMIIFSKMNKLDKVERLTVPLINECKLNKRFILEVDTKETVFDVLFSKEGFIVNGYENAYSGLNLFERENNEPCCISQIIIESKTKRYTYTALITWVLGGIIQDVEEGKLC